MMELANKLQARAKQALKNQSEITSDLCERCASDALEACSGRLVAYYVMEDFAYYRLKLYLKIEPSEEDMKLYDMALKAIQNSPFVKESGDISSAKFYKSRARKEVL